MLAEAAKDFLNATPFFVLIPLLFFLIYRSHLIREEYLIAAYLTVGMTAGFISYGLWLGDRPNLWVLHIYPLIELPLALMAISLHIKKTKKIFHLALMTSLVFIGLSILNSSKYQPLNTFNSLSKVVESLIISVFSGYALFRLSDSVENRVITKLPFFWILSGMLIYFLASIFIFGLSNSILYKDKEMNMLIWVFHSGVLLIQYILISVGFVKARAR